MISNYQFPTDRPAETLQSVHGEEYISLYKQLFERNPFERLQKKNLFISLEPLNVPTYISIILPYKSIKQINDLLPSYWRYLHLRFPINLSRLYTRRIAG